MSIPCQLSPYTLKMHILLLKLRFGCHLGLYTLKCRFYSLKLASSIIYVPKLLKCHVLALVEDVIFQAFKQERVPHFLQKRFCVRALIFASEHVRTLLKNDL